MEFLVRIDAVFEFSTKIDCVIEFLVRIDAVFEFSTKIDCVIAFVGINEAVALVFIR